MGWGALALPVALQRPPCWVPPWLTRGRPGEVIVGSLGRGVARSRGPAPGDRLTPALCRSLTRTAGCCPCWSACASCSCHSSCCATSRRGPGCPFSSPRTPTSSPSCCSSLSQMVTSCPSPCAWRPGLGHGEARDGLGSREMGSVLERDSRQGFGFRPARPKLFLQASLVPPPVRSGPHCWTGPRPGAEEQGTRLGGSCLGKQPRPILGPPLWSSVSPSVSKQVARSFLKAQLLSHVLSCRGPKVEVTSRVPGLLTLGDKGA